MCTIDNRLQINRNNVIFANSTDTKPTHFSSKSSNNLKVKLFFKIEQIQTNKQKN